MFDFMQESEPKNPGDTITRSDLKLPDTADMTNNFYDNTETYSLPGEGVLIEGEIANPGKSIFQSSEHSVIVKEALLDSPVQTGLLELTRYDGYSLFDILDDRILKKANSKEFKPIIDLYIEIENDKGEKAILAGERSTIQTIFIK